MSATSSARGTGPDRPARIGNYVDLDFRSLGTYSRADLDRIAAAPDAF